MRHSLQMATAGEAWQLSDDEHDSARALDSFDRYVYFVQQVAARGVLWVLADGEDIATAEHGSHVAVWPHCRYAEDEAKGAWATCAPGRSRWTSG